jgi:hypothetical protein
MVDLGAILVYVVGVNGFCVLIDEKGGFERLSFYIYTYVMRRYDVSADGYVSLCLGGSSENVKNILRGNICVIPCI